MGETTDNSELFQNTQRATDESDLFEHRYLNIIHDGEEKNLSTKELFDSQRFHTIYAITYVSSASFFFNTLKQFDCIELVLGIDDNQVQNSFSEGLIKIYGSPDAAIKLWNSFDEQTKKKISQDHIKIRYPRPGTIVHSKLYLLQGKHDTRVIIGSANFTRSAFQSQKQFEELMVFDNDKKLFESYKERFKDIFNLTIDYIPENLKKRKPSDIVFTGDDNTLIDILKERTSQANIRISEKQLESIQESDLKLTYRKKELERTKQVINLITRKNRAGKVTFLSDSAMAKKVVPLKAVVCRINDESESLDNRREFYFNEKDNLLYALDKGQIDFSDQLVLFSKEAGTEKIRKSLQLINTFIEAYSSYTMSKSLTTQTRIFETILYTFFSCYIWKVRQDHVLEQGSESVRSDISPFVVIAGRANSGKTSLLEFLSRLVGNHVNQYIPYNKLASKQGMDYLLDYFFSENISPIFVDEVSVKFFTSTAKNKGEHFIKTIANDLDTKHPVLICTTNTTEFQVSPQVLRRVYYLEISNVFNEAKKNESSKFLTHIRQNTNSELFADFSYRLGTYLKSNNRLVESGDFLKVTRDIFKDYYAMTNLPLPKWFSNEIMNDYYERGSHQWRILYETYKKHFIVKPNNALVVKMNEFTRSGWEEGKYKNLLHAGCIKEDAQILVLKKDQFFKFIGYGSSNSFLRKVGQLFKR